jgi:hypothetical protein
MEYVFEGHIVSGTPDDINRLSELMCRLDVLEAKCGWTLSGGCKCLKEGNHE